MTELELFDKVNPRRDLPQATCDVISQVYKIMNVENEQPKENVIVWHKQDDRTDDIYDTINDWGIHKYLCKMKDGSFNIATGSADEDCNGLVGRSIFFEINDENYYGDDIVAWAEITDI